MRINPISSNSFQGVPFANVKVKGINASYKLYQLNKSDNNYLKSLYSSLNLKKLMPNLTEQNYIVWNELVAKAIETTNQLGRQGVLETCNGKPCGIMNFIDAGKKLYLAYISTFPIKTGERVPFAGQILFNDLFKRFLSGKSEKIELSALRSGPFDPVGKYLKLGFIMLGGDYYTEKMIIERPQAKVTFEKQNKLITYDSLENQENQDLYEKTRFCNFLGW